MRPAAASSSRPPTTSTRSRSPAGAVGQNAAGIAVPLQIDLSASRPTSARTRRGREGRRRRRLRPRRHEEPTGTPQRALVKGLAVVATSFETVRTIAIGLAGGARFGVAGSGGVTVDRPQGAGVDRRRRPRQPGNDDGESTDQSVLVLASDRTDQIGVAGSVALGGTAGIGAGVEVGVLTKHTEAWIGSAPRSRHRPRAGARDSEEKIVSVAAGAGGIDVGIAGAVDVYVIDNHDEGADRGHGTVAARRTRRRHRRGQRSVAAESDTEVDFIAGKRRDRRRRRASAARSSSRS